MLVWKVDAVIYQMIHKISSSTKFQYLLWQFGRGWNIVWWFAYIFALVFASYFLDLYNGETIKMIIGKINDYKCCSLKFMETKNMHALFMATFWIGRQQDAMLPHDPRNVEKQERNIFDSAQKWSLWLNFQLNSMWKLDTLMFQGYEWHSFLYISCRNMSSIRSNVNS